MRYEQIRVFINLIQEMQTRRQGVSLSDIQELYNVSRRTAERMRDVIEAAYPYLIEVQIDEIDRVKRWRLSSDKKGSVLPSRINAGHLTALKLAIRLLDEQGLEIHARNLTEVQCELCANMESKALNRAEPDFEVLAEAEGIALRPGSRPIGHEPDIQKDLRHAILTLKQVEIGYQNKGNAEETRSLILEPYGFIYGIRHFLLARRPDHDDLRLFRLSRIRTVTLTETSFSPQEDFDFKTYVTRSFGVFQEESLMVRIEIAAGQAAEDARHYQFHPSQQIISQPDGSVQISFTACGAQEMCWEFFKWGSSLRILEPESLKTHYRYLLEDVMKSHAADKS